MIRPTPSRRSMRLVAIFFLASCAFVPPCGSQERRVLIRMASETGGDHPTAAALRETSRLAERASDGRVRIRVYENGSLGDESELMEQLRFGGVDVAAVSARALEGLSRSAAQFSASGGFEDRAAMDAAFEGKEGQTLRAELEAERLLLLSWYDGGPECLLLPRGLGDADVRGLRIGVERSTSAMRTTAETGAVPVPIPAPDIRRALESGLIEGVRAPLSFVVSSRFSPDYVVARIDRRRQPVVIVGSRISLMKMPEGDRRILMLAIDESRRYQENALSFLEERFLADSGKNGR